MNMELSGAVCAAVLFTGRLKCSRSSGLKASGYVGQRTAAEELRRGSGIEGEYTASSEKADPAL